jgi:hypothetical protein
MAENDVRLLPMWEDHPWANLVPAHVEVRRGKMAGWDDIAALVRTDPLRHVDFEPSEMTPAGIVIALRQLGVAANG